jgi:hypothetical protein
MEVSDALPADAAPDHGAEAQLHLGGVSRQARAKPLSPRAKPRQHPKNLNDFSPSDHS